MNGSDRAFALPGFAGRLYGGHSKGIRGHSRGEPKRPRVLLLHGFTGDAGDWALWPDGAPTALAIDLPGHGASPDPTGVFGDEIQRLLAVLPPSIDHVLGYSLGGRIALSLLAAAPGRFHDATILSAHPGLIEASQREARRVADQRWIALLRNQGIGRFVDAWQRQPLFATQIGLPTAVLERQRQRRLAQRAEGLAQNLTCFGLAEMPETTTALRSWPGRLRWLVGALDLRFLAIAGQIVEMRAGTELCQIPNAGHNLLLEAPTAVQRRCLPRFMQSGLS